jgi:hypothetical protein
MRFVFVFFFFFENQGFIPKLVFFMKKKLTPSLTYVGIYSRADNQWVFVPDSNNRATRG